MSKNQSIIVRVQSPDGTKRVTVSPSINLYQFFTQVAEQCHQAVDGFSLYRTRDKSVPLRRSSKTTLKTSKINHGDMVYLFPSQSIPDAEKEPSPSLSSVEEDEVDMLLNKQDGKIHRRRNELLCRHGSNAKCVHCVPLEPYDEEFLKTRDPPIKHLSFHSYIRQLTGGADKGKFAYFENISCKIKPGCTEHAPWPAGICTKCQPSAFTLDRQKYRHVDNVMFENPQMFDRFLDYWRKTGKQRIGFLIGRYEVHKDVPLGIKATVSVIYEPPQNSLPNSIELLEDPNKEIVDFIAEKLGLRRVGWIFTDLVPDDVTKGTVKHVRNLDAHFLSAEECIMAGDFQNEYPNPCKLAEGGHFGSKFATCIVTGDSQNQIHTEAYQVSNQCMALVRDDCFIPTIDAPELGYIRESSSQQYVPDVFYSETDSYGNKSKSLARPLPVEFLLVDVPSAFSKESIFTFNPCSNLQPFPSANRSELGELQDIHALSTYMRQFTADQFMEAMMDFNLLVYLATLDVLPLKDSMDPLLQALKTRDAQMAHAWSKSEQWATVGHFIAAANSPSVGISSGPPGGGFGAGQWTCAQCTFINTSSRNSCEICEGPRT